MRSIEAIESANREGLALTLDDIRLRTRHSEVMPNSVSLKSKFSRNTPLNIPIISSPMDTVTEYKLARELAKLGGLGILHRNLTPAEQEFHVWKVKYHLHGKVQKPVCVSGDRIISEILEESNRLQYGFHSFPVLDENNRLIGILTGNDFAFCDNKSSLTARDIMTKEIITAPEDTSSDQAYEIMKKYKKKVLPLIDNDRRVVALYTWTDVIRAKTGESAVYNVDSRGQLRVGAAVGVLDDAFSRLELLVKADVDVIVIDTSHGDSQNVIYTLKSIKQKYPNLDVVVGNISEAESAKNLCEAGADGLRVGQGPGSICTTRIITGTGCPQVTAVYNCSKIADEYKIPVCADGGLRFPGDIPVAIGVGAHSVMMGSMLAGTDEAPGKIVFFKGKRWKDYRGMGSIGAMELGRGARERYNQEDLEKDKLVPEGVEGLVEYKGPIRDVVYQYVGGLKKSMGLQGFSTIDKLRENADFWRITSAGQRESHPHDILITREPPNYQIRD